MAAFLKRVSGALQMLTGRGVQRQESTEALLRAYEHALNKGFDGSKYIGDWGRDLPHHMDLEKLRVRALQLFEQNSYGSGIIRRICTNVINSGLDLEAVPDGRIILGQDLNRWSEYVESRFNVWNTDRDLVDVRGESNFSEVQKRVYLEALVTGDCLLVVHEGKVGGTPKLEIISGARIRSNSTLIPGNSNHTVEDGIEFSSNGKRVACHVVEDPYTYKLGGTVKAKRVLFKGTNYRAFLYRGTNVKEGQIRGLPILTPILSLIRSVDSYRGATVRKSLIGSLLTIFLRRQQGSSPTGSFLPAASYGSQETLTADDGGSKKNDVSEMLPGLIVSHLAVGEEPVSFQSNGEINFPEFETAVISSASWSLGIPPEILRLSFSSNYSASQAAINELMAFNFEERMRFAAEVNKPTYEAWLRAEVSNGRINAPGIDSSDYAYKGAWFASEWIGSIKPSMDQKKTAQAWKEKIEMGVATRAMASRAMDGRRFSTIIRIQRAENELLAWAREPLREVPDTVTEEIIDAEE